MLKVGVMQPYFVPYIGYWQLLNAVDVYVVYDDVNYINRGWINRNRILVNGEPKYFNLLIEAASQNKLINEIEICKDEKHIQKLFRMLELNYRKAPFYTETMELLRRVLNSEEKNLALFLYEQIMCVAEYLDIDTKIVLSSSLKKDCSLHGEEKILEICRVLNATEYYNAIGGCELYSKDNFSKNKIDLKFLKTNDICYKQYGEHFYDNLSIIDVLMFNGRSVTKELLKEFHTV